MKTRKTVTALLIGSALAVGAIGGAAIHGHANSVLEGDSALHLTEDAQTPDEAVGDAGVLIAAASEEDIFSPISMVDTSQIGSGSTFTYANVADVAEAVMPSVVAITSSSVQEVRSWFYGQSMKYTSKSAGSGIIVGSNDTELLLCTNNHVVEGASELTVTFIDDESVEAYIKGTDAEDDLAVVAVNLDDIPQETMDQIKIARIGDDDAMRVGEQIVAIGNALGYGQSVTTGIISAKDRSITVTEENGYSSWNTTTVTYEGLLQVDAAINPGNSGGALLNMNGEVIGINCGKSGATNVEGVGYAIPVSKAMPILEDLMTKVTRTKVSEGQRGYVGVNGQSVSVSATALYGIPQGVYVTYVAEDSPAREAGLQEGDIITGFDGESISGMEDFQERLQYYASGETVDMTVYTQSSNGMGYEEKTVSVTLGTRSYEG